jgi:hypothetical protein
VRTGEHVEQGEEAARRDAGWRRLISANPTVDGDLLCSGPANNIRVMRGEATTPSDLAGRARRGQAVRGERSVAFEPGRRNGEKNRGGHGVLREEERGVGGAGTTCGGGLRTAGMAPARRRRG